MNVLRSMLAVLWLIVGTTLGGCSTNATSNRAVEPAQVLMVCEHGSVKSLMAASYFNQAAAERHLPFRAISRGVSPDAAVPPPVAAALSQEGFEVSDFVPTRFNSADLVGTSRVVAIGVDPSVLGVGGDVTVDSWSDVPPASVNYGDARASLKSHVEALLTELQQQRAH